MTTKASLRGLATGAPSQHNGLAATLEDMLQSHAEHITAGHPGFLPSAQERADLVPFLLSIDETTEAFPVPPNSELCPPTLFP